MSLIGAFATGGDVITVTPVLDTAIYAADDLLFDTTAINLAAYLAALGQRRQRLVGVEGDALQHQALERLERRRLEVPRQGLHTMEQEMADPQGPRLPGSQLPPPLGQRAAPWKGRRAGGHGRLPSG